MSSIPPGRESRRRVDEAIAHWHEHRLRIRFRPRTNETGLNVHHRAGRSAACASDVGRRAARRNGLADTCASGNIIHELGHTVGLWHEQCRADRDDWSRSSWAMSMFELPRHNFEPAIFRERRDLGDYDFGSIMHYPASAFAWTPPDRPAAQARCRPGVVIGQRDALSPGDIAAVEKIYAGVPKLA